MVSSADNRSKWGLLPEDVIARLRAEHWQNYSRLKILLGSDAGFPLAIALKPPKGNAALADIGRFQELIASWRGFARSDLVQWQSRSYRALGEQEVPASLVIPDIATLASLLGADAERQLRQWQGKIKHLIDALLVAIGAEARVNCERELFQALVAHLEIVKAFKANELELLIKLIPQLKPALGQGCYLRALPVTDVDTKFIETNRRIIEAIVAATIDKEAKEVGLLNWLDCREKPKHWLLVKPLCAQTKGLLGGVPLLRLSADTLQEFELPASNILVVENEQSCLALGAIRDTVAVAGGGSNVAWLQAEWLSSKNVGYWGDIDSEGLRILSTARAKLSSITALMMDAATVEAFAERMVAEPDSVAQAPIALTEPELALFNRLRSGHYHGSRLEQERLPLNYVMQELARWLA